MFRPLMVLGLLGVLATGSAQAQEASSQRRHPVRVRPKVQLEHRMVRPRAHVRLQQHGPEIRHRLMLQPRVKVRPHELRLRLRHRSGTAEI